MCKVSQGLEFRPQEMTDFMLKLFGLKKKCPGMGRGHIVRRLRVLDTIVLRLAGEAGPLTPSEKRPQACPEHLTENVGPSKRSLLAERNPYFD